MQWEGAWIYDEPVEAEENRYRYNSKEYSKGSRLYDYGARYYAADIGRWAQVDPLADDAPDWTPYRYGFNNPVLFTDPDGLFETKAEAKQYAKDNDVRTGLFSRNKIKEQNDGTFAIENKKEHTSISADSEFGVMTSVMISPDDVLETRVEGGGFDIFNALTITEVLRDGSEISTTPDAGTAPGPGKVLKGYNYVKTIGNKFDVFEKTVKSKSLSGQARAVYTKVQNEAGKTIRFFKDSFKRDGRHYERANKHPYTSRSRKLD